MSDVSESSTHGNSPPNTIRIRINNSQHALSEAGEQIYLNARVMDELPPNYKDAVPVPYRVASNGHLVIDAGEFQETLDEHARKLRAEKRSSTDSSTSDQSKREREDTASPLPDDDDDDSETETSVEPPYSGNWKSHQALAFSQQMQRRENQTPRRRQTVREEPEEQIETEVTEGDEEDSAQPVQAVQHRNKRLLKSGFNDEFMRIIQEEKKKKLSESAAS